MSRRPEKNRMRESLRIKIMARRRAPLSGVIDDIQFFGISELLTLVYHGFYK
jgi:hypothetical protein